MGSSVLDLSVAASLPVPPRKSAGKVFTNKTGKKNDTMSWAKLSMGIPTAEQVSCWSSHQPLKGFLLLLQFLLFEVPLV